MNLFETCKIGTLKLQNRITMAPMGIGGLVNPDGTMSEQGIDYFVRRAQGGVGLIRVGFTRTNADFEHISDKLLKKHLYVDDKVHISWLSRLVEAVHDYGTKISIQLSVGVGRIAGQDLQQNGRPIGPSKLKCHWHPHVLTNQLSTEEIQRIVKSFYSSAILIKKAGFDAIEIHGHEGYLLDQFITSIWNHRTDEFGGSLENRLRFSTQIINAIKRANGYDYPVIYRFGLAHHMEGGREIEEGLEIARLLEKAGADALDIDSGCYETWYYPHPPTTMTPGFDVEYAGMVKKIVSIPVIASGKLGYPELAESVIKHGKADLISLGRPLLADPDWSNKVKSGKLEEICYCLGCHEGCLKRIFDHKHISCAVNPATGNENRMLISPTTTPKKVLVIGAGVAGMEAARVCAIRGHKVELWESNNYLGGNFNTDFLPDFKNDYKLYVDYLINQLKLNDVTCRLNETANEQTILEHNPEVVIMATGSKVNIPSIPGIDLENVVFAKEVFEKHVALGSSIVIIGGGIIGLETALFYAQKGKKVTILECQPVFGSSMFLPNRMHILKLLHELEVQMIPNAIINMIDKNTICYSVNNKSENLEVDSIVIATGLSSNNELHKKFDIAGIDLYQIGDCIKPRKVIDAIWEAYKTARLI